MIGNVFFMVVVLLVSIFLFYLAEVISVGQYFKVIVLNIVIVIGFFVISYRFLLTDGEQQFVNLKLLAFKNQMYKSICNYKLNFSFRNGINACVV